MNLTNHRALEHKPDEERDRTILAVFCDIGNVLIETQPIIEGATRFAAGKSAQVGFDVEPEAFARAYLTVDSNTDRPHINHLFGDRTVAARALKTLTGQADIRYAGAFLSYYRAYVRDQIKPVPEAISFFETLAELPYIRLGIISDGTTDDQLDALNRLGLLPYLDPELVLISEEFRKEKSTTAIFEEGLKRSLSSPERTFMIGDNLERDILVPKKLGIRTIFFSKYAPVTNLRDGVEPDYICRDFSDCLTLFGKIVALSH